MAYASTTLHLLIAAPGDIPEEDILTIEHAVNRWNANYGPNFQMTIIPIRWTRNAAPAAGGRPQDFINKQLVDDADLAIALFWSRLGTDTGEAVSGTAEEVERMVNAGKHVGILQCKKDVPYGADSKQQAALQAYLTGLGSSALVLDYRNDTELVGRVENLMSKQATSFLKEAKLSRGGTDTEDLGIWPSVDFRERVKTDSKGRARTVKSYYLAIANMGRQVAHDVEYTLNPDGIVQVFNEGQPIRSIPPTPEGKVLYQIATTDQSANQFDCTVTWTDASGERRSNTATLRLV
ncbi:hypothetical protein [Streptomyces agglomeratus]|uniref:hypothetical protein n=1 Tax=Streptomyces agglomeratus TaxID=285458 RepID=UPI00114CCEC1|nr:hypothetical protein [Streptomyces agglomeratus]